MSSSESLSWHTAASYDPIDCEDDTNHTKLAEAAPANTDDGRKNRNSCFVSDNCESRIFIGTHTIDGKRITSKGEWKNDSIRWSFKTEPNCQRVRLNVPWIIILISVIQIVVHHIGCDNTIGALIFTPTKRHDVWRFLSYDFVHSGPLHLYSNVVLQILVATPLETEQGHFRVLAVYFGGVLFGALGSAFTNPGQSIVGASAGVYSLLISHISHIVLNWSTLSHRILRIVAVTVMCCSDVAFICLYGSASSKENQLIPKISVAAHSCGALAGLLFGFAAFHRWKECGERFNNYRLTSIILLVSITTISAYALFWRE